jgi:hypothetical protein
VATTGKAAWSKYFNTGKNIETVLKKQSKFFDVEDEKILGTLDVGTEIVFITTKAFDKRPQVKVVKTKSTPSRTTPNSSARILKSAKT